MAAEARCALVFGASGQIGRPLLHRLAAAGWRTIAVSRAPQAPVAGVHWLRGGFDRFDAPPARCDLIASCGPLDRFAQWYAASRLDCPRVVAFGSTSIAVKRDSADDGERDLADRLHRGERGVFAAAAARGAAATVLRPTLVYGGGGDRTLTRIAGIAARRRRFVLPRDATGLRQPVHVDDLAQAAFAAVDRAAAHGGTYALPGGETLAYRDMVARVLAALRPPARLHVVAPPVFRAMLAAAQAVGVARDFNRAALARLRDDLVFDAGPARRDLGYAPRAFAPDAAMFDPRPR